MSKNNKNNNSNATPNNVSSTGRNEQQNGKRPRSTRSYGNRKQRRSQRTESNYSSDRANTASKNGSNDISWYSKYPNLLVAAGAFPYPYRPGMTLPFGDGLVNAATSPTQFGTTYPIPGVMCLDWIPSLGRSIQATDPASIMAKEIYARVRASFSGSLEADAPDFVMYLMALDSIFSYIAWLKRVFRTINAFSPENYATPDQLLAAYGFSTQEITELREDKALLWQNINSLVLMSRKFTCPAVMDIFNRHYWMNDNVYTDAPTMNAQFYVFNQAAYFKYDDVAVPSQPTITASGLRYVSVTHAAGNVVQDLYAFGRTLIEQLVAWDDSYTISGYLARAYQGVPSFSVDEIQYDAHLEPMYNEEVLMQIENSRPVFTGNTAYKFWTDTVIAQEPATNAVISTCEYNTAFMVSTNPEWLAIGEGVNEMLSQRATAPTVADNVIASRLHASTVFDVDPDNTKLYRIRVSAGTEIPVRWRACMPLKNDALRMVNLWTELYSLGSTLNSLIDIDQLAFVAQFDWHPFQYFGRFVGTAPNYTSCNYSLLGDLHTIAVITKDQLRQLHRVCLYSEFNAFQQ